MLKFFFILCFFLSVADALENRYAVKIIQNIVAVLDKEESTVWMDVDTKTMLNPDNLKKCNIVSSCTDAKVLIVSGVDKVPEECRATPMLVLEYDLLSKHNNAVAAFFWKKGRPNIVFIKDRIDKYSISLPPSYDKYIEEELW